MSAPEAVGRCADAEFVRRVAALSLSPPEPFWREIFFRSAAARGRSWDSLRSLGRRAYGCGRAYGRSLAPGGASPSELCRAAGLHVRALSAPPLPHMELFGLFDPPDSVFLRQDLLDRCDRYRSDSGLDAALGPVRTGDVVLAHEYFHFLEERDRKTIFTRTHTEPSGLLGRRSHLPPLSEIAAMSFAQELLGLHWTPLLLDCILLSLSDRRSAYSLLERLEGFAAETSGWPER